MKKLKVILAMSAMATVVSGDVSAATRQQLEEQSRLLPSVAENDLPALANKRQPFRGSVSNAALRGHTYVRFPFVENPGSFCFDHQGRLYVAEAHRFGNGVPDLRGKRMMVSGDFRSRTVEDRLKLYEEWSLEFPENWFRAVADRIVRLEDRDGNGAADHRSVFADSFNDPLDGIGFSVVADEHSVYFTCIPNVWKLTDTDNDGVADSREKIAEGFGTQISFTGHDLHGLAWGPDGRLYFSIGDRGYNVTSKEGRQFENPCRGAIFRCYPDGTGFEVYCQGLRNPQELAFDDHGNLFTFDNTGDIGDVARMVYALEGTDSGWHMSHQAAHQYADLLDWGEFRPEKSMWVAERMFDTYNQEQPQWVYPPASHVANGPSGVTYLTGESIPGELRNTFLLADYRGAAPNCTVMAIRMKPVGAGFEVVSAKNVIKGIGVTDVEQGFDGRIYLCDFGGGWRVNQSGSIQVLEATDPTAREAGERVGRLFAQGFDKIAEGRLQELLGHPDKRVRQQAQFELARRGRWEVLRDVAVDGNRDRLARLHALWGLGQIAAKALPKPGIFTRLLGDDDPIVRANAARAIGDLKLAHAKAALIKAINDPVPQVRSLSAIALGRVAPREDAEAIDAVFDLAARNGESDPDIVIRHSCLTALETLNAIAAAKARVDSVSREERLMAVLVLRRKDDPALQLFLEDTDRLIRAEVVRAIYDTEAMDTSAGVSLARIQSIKELPEPVQRRVVAANFRIGKPENANRLLDIAGNRAVAPTVRNAALQGLRKWTHPLVTDPVLGHYRPLDRIALDQKSLLEAIGSDLAGYLSREEDPELLATGLRLANETGLALSRATLESQALNAGLSPEVRIATLDNLASQFGPAARGIVRRLIKDDDGIIRAAAIRHGFHLGLDDIRSIGRKAIKTGGLAEARAAIHGMSTADPAYLLGEWNTRNNALRKELRLDVYLALKESKKAAMAKVMKAFAEASATNVFSLCDEGGDATRGRFIFGNHGACLQCHKVGGAGGVQGPELDSVATRLSRSQILESIYNPNAEITPGFASITATLKGDAIVSGRLKTEDAKAYHLILPDGKETSIAKSDVLEKTPPVSAMPPIGAALPPRDLRDLVAYLVGLDGTKKKPAKSH